MTWPGPGAARTTDTPGITFAERVTYPRIAIGLIAGSAHRAAKVATLPRRRADLVDDPTLARIRVALRKGQDLLQLELEREMWWNWPPGTHEGQV